MLWHKIYDPKVMEFCCIVAWIQPDLLLPVILLTFFSGTRPSTMLSMPRSRQSSVTSSQENLLDRVDHSRSKNSTLTRKNSGIPMFTSPPKTADGKIFWFFYLLFSWFCLRNYFQFFFVAAKINRFWFYSRMIYKKTSRIWIWMQK